MTFRITKPGFYRDSEGGRKCEVLAKRGEYWYGIDFDGAATQWDSRGVSPKSYNIVAEWVEPVVETVVVLSNGEMRWRRNPYENKLVITTRKITLRDGKIVDVTDEVG